jgi:hypothetical protein
MGVAASTKPDAYAVARSIAYLKEHGCPNPQRGEGSALFKPRTGLKTPDVVAGDFRGETNPWTFFVDVVAPSGDQVTKERAGAPDVSRFLMNEIKMKSGQERTLSDVPIGLGKPLVGSLLTKADKYASARSGSPLLGLIAYFNERGSGQQLLTMLHYLKAVHDELGQLSEHLTGLLVVTREHSAIVHPVKWDHPFAFLIQLVDDGRRCRGVVVVNQHARLDAFREHEVSRWLESLLSSAVSVRRP